MFCLSVIAGCMTVTGLGDLNNVVMVSWLALRTDKGCTRARACVCPHPNTALLVHKFCVFRSDAKSSNGRALPQP